MRTAGDFTEGVYREILQRNIEGGYTEITEKYRGSSQRKAEGDREVHKKRTIPYMVYLTRGR